MLSKSTRRLSYYKRKKRLVLYEIRYIQPEHNWYPRIKKMEKVTNHGLEVKWLNASKKLVDLESRQSLQLHGTSVDGVEEITEGRFNLQ